MKTEETKMVNYINKSSKHLFKRSGTIAFRPNSYKHQEYMFKLFIISIDGTDHRVKVEFNESVTNVKINEIISYDKNSFNIMKTGIFNDNKTTSIKSFKKVKEIMNLIKKEYDSKEEATSYIKTIFENGK